MRIYNMTVNLPTGTELILAIMADTYVDAFQAGREMLDRDYGVDAYEIISLVRTS